VLFSPTDGSSSKPLLNEFNAEKTSTTAPIEISKERHVPLPQKHIEISDGLKTPIKEIKPGRYNAKMAMHAYLP
jgi:hypothetical protein